MSEKEISDMEIDRYLEGSMTDAEKVSFEERLAYDTEFKNEVELQRSIIKAVRREQLEKIVQREETQIGKQKNIRKLVFTIGSFALAASLFGFFYVGYLNSCASLADRYYLAYANTPIPSRGGETLPQTKSDSLFFDALKQLGKGNSRNAVKQLKNLQDNPQEMNVATDYVLKWYLALAYLKSGKKQKAKELLRLIIQKPSGKFYTKAKDLLKEIEN